MREINEKKKKKHTTVIEICYCPAARIVNICTGPDWVLFYFAHF